MSRRDLFKKKTLFNALFLDMGSGHGILFHSPKKVDQSDEIDIYHLNGSYISNIAYLFDQLYIYIPIYLGFTHTLYIFIYVYIYIHTHTHMYIKLLIEHCNFDSIAICILLIQNIIFKFKILVCINMSLY